MRQLIMQTLEKVMAWMKGRHASFDAVLLGHVQNLPGLPEVVLTETVYKQRL